MRFRVPASVEIVRPKTRDAWLERRKPNIGASAAGALLGVHSYQTLFGLYGLKAGLIAEDPEETPAMRRGRLLEPVAIDIFRDERPLWRIEANPIPGGAVFVDRAARLSATPDAFVIDPDRAGYGILQVKTVDSRIFRETWRDAETGDVVPPLWIGVQAILDAHFSGASWGAIGALVIGAGLEPHIIDVPIHAGIVARVREAAAHFWQMVEAGTAPDPDFARDGEAIARMFAEDNGETIDLAGDNEAPELVDEHERLSAEKAAADRSLKAVKAALLAKLGAAAAGTLADGRLITAKTVHRDAYSVAPSSYRSIRIKAAPSRSGATAYQGEF